MNVYLNEITGIPDAIVSMFMSKRSWTKEKEEEIRRVCTNALNPNGSLHESAEEANLDTFTKWFNTLCKWGKVHTTMLRFIDFSFTVEGIHRGAQDDFDSHAKRLENRIIRSSTRLANFDYEMSDWYKEKIIPTDVAMKYLNVDLPSEIVVDNQKYIKSINGYIKEGMEKDNDVKRGLYMLSIPSNFICKVNCTEFGHIYKERNQNSSANPELKMAVESMAIQTENFHKQLNRDLYLNIKN